MVRSWLVLDVGSPLILIATATVLLLQQAAAASCGGAFQGILKLEALFFWLVLDVANTFVLECSATATELLLQQAAAASAIPVVLALVAHYIFLVGKEFVTVFYREVGHTTASSLTVGNGEQASGRVDVPGGGLQLSSAASQVFGKVPGHSETEHEVHQINCGIGENATFQVLVKQFSGKHLAVLVHSDWLVADLVHCLQLRSLVPADAFYLVKAGRRLDSCKSLREEKLLAGDTVTMCGRLKGGSSNFASHADWYCAACSKAGVGRRDSNVIGVASRELRVRKFWLVCLLEEAKEEAKLQVKVLLCLQGKRSSLVDLQGHKCLRAPLGGPPGNRKPRGLNRRRLLLLRKIVVL